MTKKNQDDDPRAQAFSEAFVERGELGLKLNREKRPVSCAENVFLVMTRDERWQGVLAWDEFSGRVVKVKAPPLPRAELGEWTQFDDVHARLWLSQVYDLRVSDNDFETGMLAAADMNRISPVREYLESLTWDGMPRLDLWLDTYLGAGDTWVDDGRVPVEDYIRYLTRVGPMFLISAVARAFQPGCKVDHVLILEGPQGAGKSSVVRVLGDPWVMDTPITIGDKDGYIAIRGKWFVEVAELDSFNKAESSAAKRFYSASFDTYRDAYGRRAADVQRQCVFIGTVNHNEYFRDETGNRRYWPVAVGKIDLERLRKDRDQLFAEAVARYAKGERWWPEPDERPLFESIQDARLMRDAWEEVIADYLVGKNEVTAAELLGDALKLDRARWTRQEQTRVGICMHKLGWLKVRLRDGGIRQYGWRKPKQGEATDA